MKTLITGGNKGLGLYLTEKLNADSISRENGFDITKDEQRIAEKSLDYDVFINNAFDGPPHEPWANFGQVNVYHAVFAAWKNANKTGHIFNIGSVGAKSIVPIEPKFETYRVSKSALEHASKQGTHSFKANQIKFKTTLITLDRLDTPLSRSRASWTGNGLNLKNIHGFIDLCLNLDDNTCIEETIFYCNLDLNR
jgi:NAD(P)-dependent dehydrogenase (short-subunit alcohol dehydrogenase family)